jgi:hypothetical protein
MKRVEPMTGSTGKEFLPGSLFFLMLSGEMGDGVQ